MNEIKVKSVYKHFKGDYYFVEDIVIHSETREKYVVYRALYGDYGVYVRPYNMFASEVDHRNQDKSCQINNKEIICFYKENSYEYNSLFN